MLQLLQQIHLRGRVRARRAEAERGTPHIARTARGRRRGRRVVKVVLEAVVVGLVLEGGRTGRTSGRDGVVVVVAGAVIADHVMWRIVQRCARRRQHRGVMVVQVVIVLARVGRVVRQGYRLGALVEDRRVGRRLVVAHVVLGHVRVHADAAALQLGLGRGRLAELGPQALVRRLDALAALLDLLRVVKITNQYLTQSTST